MIEESEDAVRLATACIVFAIAIYFFSFLICCKRKCCTVKLCSLLRCVKPNECFKAEKPSCARYAFDGRCVSYRYSRYACLFISCVALCGALLVMIFFLKYPNTQPYVLQSPNKNCTSDAVISPCTMSNQVFLTFVTSYAFFIFVVCCSWNSCVLCLPLICVNSKIYRSCVADDVADLSFESCMGKKDEYVDLSEEEDVERFAKTKVAIANRFRQLIEPRLSKNEKKSYMNQIKEARASSAR